MEQLQSFREILTQFTLVDVIEFVGTLAFAVSGVRLAAAKEFDWFGAMVVGFVTAVGGGTLRDLLIGVPPFWLQSSVYVWGTLLAFIVVLFRKILTNLNNTIFWFDCVGLGLFTVVGFEKALVLGHAYWVCIFMGTITGVVGGIIRDMLINEIPVIFRQELYAFPCIVGGCIFALFDYLQVDSRITQIFVFVMVILVRALAMRFGWNLPILKNRQ